MLDEVAPEKPDLNLAELVREFEGATYNVPVPGAPVSTRPYQRAGAEAAARHFAEGNTLAIVDHSTASGKGHTAKVAIDIMGWAVDDSQTTDYYRRGRGRAASGAWGRAGRGRDMIPLDFRRAAAYHCRSTRGPARLSKQGQGKQHGNRVGICGNRACGGLGSDPHPPSCKQRGYDPQAWSGRASVSALRGARATAGRHSTGLQPRAAPQGRRG